MRVRACCRQNRSGRLAGGRWSIAAAREAQEERDGGDGDVQPDVGVIVFDHAEWLVP